MFGVGVGVRVGGFTPVSSGGGFDPDAQAFFDRVTTAGGSLTTTEKDATNTLVVSMKADGVWSSMKAIYPMVGASAGACAQNLVSASFTGSFSSGWTFASTGVTPNGTSAMMDTNLSSNTVLTNNNLSLSFYSRTNNTNGNGDFGDKNTTGGFSAIFLYAGGLFYGYLADLLNIAQATTDTRGFYTISRSNTTQINFYRNGANFGTNPKTSVASTLNSGTLVIGQANNLYSNRQCAFATVADGLTDTQATDFYTAVQAFQTTLSRQV
jgi:hypothetical protein